MKKEIVINIEYGSKFQEQVYSKMIIDMLESVKNLFNSSHKNNKLTYKLK